MGNYGHKMRDESVTVVLHWLFRKRFFCHFIAGDVFVGCWSCSHLISVYKVALRVDHHVSFDFGFNISLCILFVHLSSIVVFSFPPSRLAVAKLSYSIFPVFSLCLWPSPCGSCHRAASIFDVDIFSVSQSLSCRRAC